MVALSGDDKSFIAFENTTATNFSISNDTIYSGQKQAYNFSGKNITHPGQDLHVLKSYQEFWHSWKTFHPETEVYK